MNIKNFEDVILYTKDRISCAGMSNGKFNEEIDLIVKNINEYLKINVDYNPLLDIDNDGNTPMHLIAKNGFYELFFVFKESIYFNYLKNMKNKNGETPLDLVGLRGDDIYLLLKPEEYINSITTLMTDRYYNVSFEKLEKIMKEYGFETGIEYKNIIINKINEFKEIIMNKENIEKLARKHIDLENQLGNMLKGLDLTREVKVEEERLQEQINYFEQKIQPSIYRVNLLLDKIKDMSSDEIKDMVCMIKDNFYKSLEGINK